jgi:hypothetical protein
MIARSTLWGTIQTGKEFCRLSPIEQQAVMAHEEGHLVFRHAWIRLGWFVTLRAFFKQDEFFEMCARQEAEADWYAVACGHAPGLISFLLRLQPDVKSDGYPTARQRLEAIRHVR